MENKSPATVGQALQQLKDRSAMRESLIHRHESSRDARRRVYIQHDIHIVENQIGALLAMPIAA